jgi:hypothetical protein
MSIIMDVRRARAAAQEGIRYTSSIKYGSSRYRGRQRQAAGSLVLIIAVVALMAREYLDVLDKEGHRTCLEGTDVLASNTLRTRTLERRIDNASPGSSGSRRAGQRQIWVRRVVEQVG